MAQSQKTNGWACSFSASIVLVLLPKDQDTTKGRAAAPVEVAAETFKGCTVEAG